MVEANYKKRKHEEEGQSSTVLSQECKQQKTSCCKAVDSFVKSLPPDLSRKAVAQIIRVIFDALSRKMGPLRKMGKIDSTKIAFDISFLWHFRSSLSTCPGDPEEKTGVIVATIDDEMVQLLLQDWGKRPNPRGVASCHPTAEDLCLFLGSVGSGEERGWRGPNQTPEEHRRMEIHQLHAKFLLESLRGNDRGIWWISHCGHSFCFISRSCLGKIEVMDSFANDRSLGYWALSPEEVASVEHVKYKKVGNDTSKAELHVPPGQRLWDLGEILPLVGDLVNSDQEKRYEAQAGLVNYMYEMPREEGEDESLEKKDRLPCGPFGYKRYDLHPDDQIVIKIAQWLYHAYANWQTYGNKRVKPLI